jgi:hypothetical protein
VIGSAYVEMICLVTFEPDGEIEETNGGIAFAGEDLLRDRA